MTIDRYDIGVGGECQCCCTEYDIELDGDWVKHTDHEQAMAEKDARIARLEAHITNIKEIEKISRLGLIQPLRKAIWNAPQASLNNIKADAIDEMLNCKGDLMEGLSFGMAKEYANNLRKAHD